MTRSHWPSSATKAHCHPNFERPTSIEKFGFHFLSELKKKRQVWGAYVCVGFVCVASVWCLCVKNMHSTRMSCDVQLQ